MPALTPFASWPADVSRGGRVQAKEKGPRRALFVLIKGVAAGDQKKYQAPNLYISATPVRSALPVPTLVPGVPYPL